MFLDFHFHEQDNAEVSSFTKVFDQINRSAIATRKFLRNSSQNVFEHGRECFDHFSDETQAYLHENSVQLSNFVSFRQ